MYRGNRDSGFRPRTGGFAPVKVGEEIEVTIEAVGEKGDGIAKKNGFVLFVPGVKQGDKVKIRVTKVLRKVGFAEVVGKGEASSSEESSEEETESAEEPSETESAEETTEETTEDTTEDTENFGEEQ